MEQEDRHVSYAEAKTVIKAHSRKRWKDQHPNFNLSDSYYKLSRPDQVVLLRLRTGHNRLNSHMFRKFGIGESEMCPCKSDIMDAEHLLQHCCLHDDIRRATWPDPTPRRDKFFEASWPDTTPLRDN